MPKRGEAGLETEHRRMVLEGVLNVKPEVDLVVRTARAAENVERFIVASG